MKDKIIYYTDIFFIYSFIGYLIELILKTFFIKKMNSGILHGPWLPVYGFGAISIVLIMRLIFNRLKINRWIKLLITLIFSMILSSVLELVGGLLIEKIFHKVFWNYDNFKYNFGHYISLEMTIIWGIASLIIIYIINPFLNKIVKKIPNIITYLVLFIFSLDVIITTLSKLHIFHQ